MYVFLYIFLILMLLFIRTTKKYANPYKLYMFFGKKGCGKTTYICKKSLYYLKKGYPVYTTEYIPGTYHIDYKDIGKVQFPRGSIIFVDEVGMIWDNREFKSFSKEVRDYFKLQRHYGHTVYLFSQCFDIDKKLRDLCDELYIVKSVFNCFSICKKVKKDLTVVEAFGEGESRITDNLQVVSFFIPGSRQFTYLPKYHKFFDSFAAPELQKKEYPLQPIKLAFTRKHLKVQRKLFFMQFREKLARIRAKVLTEMYKNGLIFKLERCLSLPNPKDIAQRSKRSIVPR